MPLLTIPNVSEGRDASVISKLSSVFSATGCRLLDVHADASHNRSVFTATGLPNDLTRGLGELAAAAVSSIDLRHHSGAHPRVGVLDVCPIVPHGEPMEDAIEAAHRAGELISERAGLPVYFYDHAAPHARSLPEIRAGGLEGLIERARGGFVPDLGPHEIHLRSGVACVGARAVLIAFNVWLRAESRTARAIAREIREKGGGLTGVRALGLALGGGRAQVSMNLTDPDRTGIDAAFAAVAERAERTGAVIEKTELVGLVPERYLPDPDAQAARLLIEPGRSLESVLAG